MDRTPTGDATTGHLRAARGIVGWRTAGQDGREGGRTKKNPTMVGCHGGVVGCGTPDG
jgi:hypothetical protein